MTIYLVTTFDNDSDAGTTETTTNKAKALRMARAHVEASYINQASARVAIEGSQDYVARYVNRCGRAVKIN